MALVDPLPLQAERLYDLQQSKVSLVQCTSSEIDQLCVIISYLKDMQQRNEKLYDKQQKDNLFQTALLATQQFNNPTTDLQSQSKTQKSIEIAGIIQFYRQKNNNHSLIEDDIQKTIESKLAFLKHVTEHISNLREEIKALTNRIKQKTFECEICFEILDAEHLCVLSNCQHRLCRVCFRRHIFSSIDRKKQTPKCPYPSCEAELSHYNDIQNALSRREYERVNYQMNMAAISRISGITYCLTPDCDNAIEYDNSSCNVVTALTKFDCKKCGNCWCLRCKVLWHKNFKTCAEYKRSVKRGKFEKMADVTYSKWYSAHKRQVKQCPGCKAHVEKNEGCNHMTCRCETEWCWLCNQVIDGWNTEEHYGYWHPQYDD